MHEFMLVTLVLPTIDAALFSIAQNSLRKPREYHLLKKIKCLPLGTRQRRPRGSRKARMRKLQTLPAQWWNVTGWKTALSGCFEQRRLYRIGHIDGRTNQSAAYR